MWTEPKPKTYKQNNARKRNANSSRVEFSADGEPVRIKCRKCDITKDVGDFYVNHTMRHGYNYKCKKCCIADSTQWIKENPNRAAFLMARHQARKRGQAAPDEFSYPQETDTFGKCELCPRVGKLVHDHDHVYGMFRGLVCARCNIRLWKVEREYEWHKRAVKLLSKSRSQL